MYKAEIVRLLALDDFSEIYKEADNVRKNTKGDIIHIRAILEFSNYCRRKCSYCGLNCFNRNIARYRMSVSEIIDIGKQAYDAGYQTLVLQSGEDRAYTVQMLGEIVRTLKAYGLVITLSCGEMPDSDYAYLRECGADRYLLKHETADPILYEKLHPCGTLENRVHCLKTIKKLGYESGSGFMIGLPGATLETIADDILLIRDLQCGMAGIGPFIPHPDTRLAESPHGSTELTKRAVALTRILCPAIHLPATTALGVLNTDERNSIFHTGANVIMRKVTPDPYKALYEIYPANFTQTDIIKERQDLEQLIKDMGRIPV